MIRKMINETQLSKKDRKKFIPFVNQRNHMGQIIKTKQKDRQYMKSIQVFQNLKKTTKQYFFDKKYQKMKMKLQRCKYSLQPKQLNYDQQVRKCFKTIQKSNLLKQSLLDQSNIGNSNFFYVDLSKKLNKNITILKQQIQNNKKNKMESTMNQFMRHNTVHNEQYRHKMLNSSGNYTGDQSLNYFQNKQNINFTKSNTYFNKQSTANSRFHRFQSNPTSPKQKKLKKLLQKRTIHSINRQVFSNLSSQSKKMVDFTNFGMKYKHMLNTQSKDPWKKWYIDEKLQVFPGQVIKVKKLQKSIYD